MGPGNIEELQHSLHEQPQRMWGSSEYIEGNLVPGCSPQRSPTDLSRTSTAEHTTPVSMTTSPPHPPEDLSRYLLASFPAYYLARKVISTSKSNIPAQQAAVSHEQLTDAHGLMQYLQVSIPPTANDRLRKMYHDHLCREVDVFIETEHYTCLCITTHVDPSDPQDVCRFIEALGHRDFFANTLTPEANQYMHHRLLKMSQDLNPVPVDPSMQMMEYTNVLSAGDLGGTGMGPISEGLYEPDPYPLPDSVLGLHVVEHATSPSTDELAVAGAGSMAIKPQDSGIGLHGMYEANNAEGQVMHAAPGQEESHALADFNMTYSY